MDLTEGLYPEQMAFGPDDIGHWKDRLPYVRYDLELIKEREDIFKRFGRFDYGFDFGAPVRQPPIRATLTALLIMFWRIRWSRVSYPSIPARATRSRRGTAGSTTSPRQAEGIPLTPYLEIRSAVERPEGPSP